MSSSSGVTYLRQKDFEKGPLIISKGGIYRFMEDVEFNPPAVTPKDIKNFPNF